MGVIVCQPGDPEAKGMVERGNGYLVTSLLSGRSFASPQDFNDQLAVWLRRVNNRVHATLRCRPSNRIGDDRTAIEVQRVQPARIGRAAAVMPKEHSCPYPMARALPFCSS